MYTHINKCIYPFPCPSFCLNISPSVNPHTVTPTFHKVVVSILYVNLYSHSVDVTLWNDVWWKFNENSNISIHEIALQYIFLESAAILSSPLYFSESKLCWDEKCSKKNIFVNLLNGYSAPTLNTLFHWTIGDKKGSIIKMGCHCALLFIRLKRGNRFRENVHWELFNTCYQPLTCEDRVSQV